MRHHSFLFTCGMAVLGAIALGMAYVQASFVEGGAGSLFVCYGLTVVLPAGAVMGGCLAMLLQWIAGYRKL
jgi:hypothetical protein